MSRPQLNHQRRGSIVGLVFSIRKLVFTRGSFSRKKLGPSAHRNVSFTFNVDDPLVDYTSYAHYCRSSALWQSLYYNELRLFQSRRGCCCTSFKLASQLLHVSRFPPPPVQFVSLFCIISLDSLGGRVLVDAGGIDADVNWIYGWEN